MELVWTNFNGLHCRHQQLSQLVLRLLSLIRNNSSSITVSSLEGDTLYMLKRLHLISLPRCIWFAQSQVSCFTYSTAEELTEVSQKQRITSSSTKIFFCVLLQIDSKTGKINIFWFGLWRRKDMFMSNVRHHRDSSTSQVSRSRNINLITVTHVGLLLLLYIYVSGIWNIKYIITFNLQNSESLSFITVFWCVFIIVVFSLF